MRTTIELPDSLAREAKEFARLQGVTLGELVIEGLRLELDRRSASGRADLDFPTVGGKGLQAGVALSDLSRMAYDHR
jgi:hypothetical protein